MNLRPYYFPFLFVGICILVQIAEFAFQTSFGFLGIYPRHASGLMGILLGPFLHGDVQHLFSNIFSFLLLSASIILFYPRLAKQVIAELYLLTGLGVWFFARPALHIGASGLVYGMASFMFFTGMFRKEPRALLLSLVIAMIYNGLLYGLLPNQKGVSWESHLAGAIVGGLVAFRYRSQPSALQVHRTILDDHKTFEGYAPLLDRHICYQPATASAQDITMGTYPDPFQRTDGACYTLKKNGESEKFAVIWPPSTKKEA